MTPGNPHSEATILEGEIGTGGTGLGEELENTVGSGETGPVPSSSHPARRSILSDGSIGHIHPSPVTMCASRGTYEIDGTLFHDEVSAVPVLKDSPVILTARIDPSNPSSETIRVFARIVGVTVDQVSTIERNSVTRQYVTARFEIVRECVPTPNGPHVQLWTPKTMGGYRVHWPEESDLELMGYPREGIELGWQQAGGSLLNYRLPPEALYRSFFVVGGMGGGKTNFVSVIARSLAHKPPRSFANGVPPAVVILDAEGRGEYADLKGDVPQNLRSQLGALGIPWVGVPDFAYFRVAPGEWTFRLNDLTPQDTAIFPATLPSKSERAWKLGAEQYWRRAVSVHRQVVAQQFTSAMATAAMPLGVNAPMRNAIVRAAQDSCWEVFDMPNSKPIDVSQLLIPGRVSVVDVSRLEGLDRQRAGGLALLTMFDIVKRTEPQNPCPVLLVIDEATRLVPATFAGMSGHEYSQKMGTWLGDILHRGRRARYGLLVATQYPDDVLSGLADQPQTKISFALPPKYDRWLGSNFATAVGNTLRAGATAGLGFVHRTSRVEGDPIGAAHSATLVQFPQVR
jgi:hypothetical protein